MKNMKMLILWFAAAMFVLNQNSDVFAKNFLYHATKKTIASKIAAKGFSSKKMNPNLHSIKNPGSTNYFIPQRVLDQNPQIIRQIRIKEGNRYR